MKATLELTVIAPEEWIVLGNSYEIEDLQEYLGIPKSDEIVAIPI